MYNQCEQRDMALTKIPSLLPAMWTNGYGPKEYGIYLLNKQGVLS